NGCGSLIGESLAATLAWSGAEDEAVKLLSSLAAGAAVLGPAMITRDPLYFVPLENNAAYRALAARLEARMQATRSARGPAGEDGGREPPAGPVRRTWLPARRHQVRLKHRIASHMRHFPVLHLENLHHAM